MINAYTYALRGQLLTLLPHKAIYWKQEKSLLIADLHLGKAGHFRKSGIPVPAGLYQNDLDRLTDLIAHFGVQKLIILGDFFHSDYNEELREFSKWRRQFSGIEVHLVKGNHDILAEKYYTAENIILHHEKMNIAPFQLTHHPIETEETNNLYNICGHIHPGVRLNGKGRQSLRLPCFWFGQRQAILPAFGRFTGTANVKTQAANDEVFVVLENKVVKV